MKKLVKKIILHLIWRLQKVNFFNSWSDEKYLKFIYKIRIGKKLNLDNPKTFNEKLQWLKIHDRNPKYTKMVDKYEAKKYVSEIVGKDYIIPTIGIYEHFEDIKFEELPQKFVIKCTHNSGGVVVVNDKNNINRKKLQKKFKNLLKQNFFYVGREYPYKNVNPKIIIEENIQPENETSQINDYKLMCFNGKVKCSFVCSNRNTESGLYVNFYDKDWNPMPFERHYAKNPIEIPKPNQYDKMVELAEKLSKNIPFVRVDFYIVKNKIFFGELTFYPGGGVEEFTPDVWDLKIGEWIDLKKIKRK